MPEPDPVELERLSIAAVRSAAAFVAEGTTGRSAVRVKSSPTDVVTQTDLAVEARLQAALLAATPDARLVAEESGGHPGSRRLSWVVDPVDGTVNLLYGVPAYAVSVAAAWDGQVVAGAVADVTRGEVWSAYAGGGARLDGDPVAVSACPGLAEALVTTGFSYDAATRRRQGQVAVGVLEAARDLRCFGSTALELCWVAGGRVDAYYQVDVRLWDWAAGALIVAEAGAQVELPCPENGGLVLAAPAAVFEDLRRVVAPWD